VRFWKPLEDNYWRFGKFTMDMLDREVDSIIPVSSHGKDKICAHPAVMKRRVREASLCNPQSKRGLQKLRFVIRSDVKFVGKPSCGKDTKLGRV
jgi:hypothetical protein